VRHVVGILSVAAYRGARRAYAKGFSLAVGGAFASFGRESVIEPPLRVGREDRIAIGSGVFIGSDCWLQAHDEGDVAIEIGDGASIVGHCVISAVRSVRLGPRCLLARGVYISDHQHAFEDTTTAVRDQPKTKIAPVEIGAGAWLGENVVVGPGVRIGRGAVIGGNSVVLSDVPDYAVAVGSPARVVRSFGDAAEAIAFAT
jgi:lipopolysaccharide O-acetyltransferase